MSPRGDRREPLPGAHSTSRRAQRHEHRRRRRVRRWLWGGGGAVVLGAGIAVALALSHAPTNQAGAAAAQVSLAPAASGATVGQKAPAFTAATVGGAIFRVPAGKPTVIYFMAGWCSTCLPEAQALAQVAQADAGRVAILAVDADPTDPLSSLQNFMRTVGNPGYAFAQDQGGRLVQAFSVPALETTVVLNAGGTVVYRNGVSIDEAALRTALAQAGVS